MGKKLTVVTFGLAVLCASQGWAGTMGNGAAQRRAAAGLPPAQQEGAPRPQSQPQQTWVLHGRTVSCASTSRWRHSEYVSHCGHG
jgi:hypothetical protein